ncbi:MAG: hypothetical protein QXN34_04890 [Archaeoglobaceae archaeon]
MVVIVGAGYSGIICAKFLKEMGHNFRIFDYKAPGGEIAIFSKIPELNEQYLEFIDEMKAAMKILNIERGCVLSTNPLRVLSTKGVEILNEKAIIATGAVDKNPVVFGKRPAGIFSLETAIKLIAAGYRIGKKILIAGNDKILDILEIALAKNYKVERTEKTDIYVHGSKRVERVECDGKEFECDTVIVYRGRKTFNPRNLSGELIGNAVVCCYDYSKVRKNVLDFINRKFEIT